VGASRTTQTIQIPRKVILALAELTEFIKNNISRNSKDFGRNQRSVMMFGKKDLMLDLGAG
jgi:hypothetical protein